MATYRNKVYIKIVDVDRDLPDGLCSISVEEYFVLSAYLSYFFDRLDDSDLIMYHNNRNHYRVRSDGFLQVLQVHDTVCAYI